MSERASFTVFCLCAAWCRTCDAYREVFDMLSRDGRKRSRWVWIDIEDHADVIGDVDIDNFPSLLISESGSVLFFGPVLPHPDVTMRLFERLTDGQSKPVSNQSAQALCERLSALAN